MQPKYQHSKPPAKLTSLVSRYFEVRLTQPFTFSAHKIPPFESGVIIFICKGSPQIKLNGVVHSIPGQVLVGQQPSGFSFASEMPLLICGVALQPTATFKLFGMHLSALKNTFIDLCEVSDKASEFSKQFKTTHDTKGRFGLLNDFITHRLPVNCTDEVKEIDELIELIYRKKGLLKTSELGVYAGVTGRCLEKRFKKTLGQSPGRFIKQVRLHFACSQIARGVPACVALRKFNYYDRSHFAKSLKNFTGAESTISMLTSKEDSLFKAVFA